MNYYNHHIGDFNNATRHLTRVERSIYRDMLDMYYDTEQPLTLDLNMLCRKLLARTNEELTAVEQVLSEFFIKMESGWFHPRCDAEISAYLETSSAKSKAGKASAAKRADERAKLLNNINTIESRDQHNGTGVEHPLDSVGGSVQLTNNQEPITNNHKPLKTKNTTPSAVAAAPKFDFAKALADRGVPEHLIAAWLHVRKTKRAVNTEIAFDGFMREVQKSGRPLSEVVETCIKRSWSGFEVDWLGSKGQISNPAPAVSSLGKHGDATAENARAWLQQSGGVPA